MTIEELLSKIEIYRHKMYEMAADKSLADPEVVYVSKLLDELLNEYYRVRYMIQASCYTIE